MKSIEIDDDLYTYIASQTKHIGESASEILRRLLLEDVPIEQSVITSPVKSVKETTQEKTKAKPVTKKVAAKAPKKVESPAVTQSVVTAVSQPGDILDKITDDALLGFDKVVERFMFILGVLHEIHGKSFSKVETIKGKNRVYFAQSKEQLLETGSSTNPKLIPNSEFWVVTNNNTAKKVNMLKQVLSVLDYSDEVVAEVVSKFS